MPKIQECGILLRGYAKTEAEVEDVVERLYCSVVRATELGFGDIIVLVPQDKDCGATARATESRICSTRRQVIIFQLKGDENRDLLNIGLCVSRERSKTHAFILSNKAVGYLTTENVAKMFEAFNDGALGTGLAVRDKKIPVEADEVYLGIIEGRISNTCAAWDLKALESVVDFDSQIGVEEIAPIVRLIKKFEACVAPILPTDQIGVNVSALRAEHHHFVMTKKIERQLQEAARAGGDFEFIKQGILPGYPK